MFLHFDPQFVCLVVLPLLVLGVLLLVLVLVLLLLGLLEQLLRLLELLLELLLLALVDVVFEDKPKHYYY
jgi:hypothetical protein